MVSRYTFFSRTHFSVNKKNAGWRNRTEHKKHINILNVRQWSYGKLFYCFKYFRDNFFISTEKKYTKVFQFFRGYFSQDWKVIKRRWLVLLFDLLSYNLEIKKWFGMFINFDCHSGDLLRILGSKLNGFMQFDVIGDVKSFTA